MIALARRVLASSTSSPSNESTSTFELAKYLAYHRHALVGREERLLLGVHENGHEHPLEQVRAPQNNVDVAVGQRIERTRKHCGRPFGGPAGVIVASS